MIKKLTLILLLFITSCTQDKPINTSFNPGELWQDNNDVHINAHGGGFLIHNETYYWFGEHKTTGNKGNKAMVGVGVYSSKDLYNWKNEGIALAVSEDPNSKLVKGCILERPKVIYNKKTANLRRSEDWEKFNAAESDKKLQRTLIGIAGGSTALALYPNKKKSKKK